MGQQLEVSPMKVYSVEKPELPPLEMSDHFRMEVVYFMTPPGTHGVPELPEGEYWIRLSDARRWLEDFVVQVVSPLDAEAKAEIELTDEHETWLQWMVDNQIQRVRLQRD
jgi:hypothetical protein